jgi:hypothetical protein
MEVRNEDRPPLAACKMYEYFNPLTPELNPSAQRCLPRFLLGILIFKGLTAPRLCKSFGVKGLTNSNVCLACSMRVQVRPRASITVAENKNS